ncbi:MAG: ATP-binding cassette domain-containing protein, partial [Alcaligenaceae bacterium]
YGMSQASQHARARLAFVPANVLSDPTQTGRGLLHAIAAEKRTLREDRVSEGLALDEAVLDLADRLGLTPHLDKRFEQMSTGTRRKVYLVAAGLGTPSVLIADGPTDGLDAQARRVVADLFLDWGRDRVVLFASHDEALVRACAARPITIASLR